MKVLTAKSKEVKDSIELAFKIGARKYYCFKRDTVMRYGRYIVLQAFLQEYYLRTDLATLKSDIQKLQQWLNPDKASARIEMGKALELLSIMEQRANIAFEPDTVYRLASCIYFEENENVVSYDKTFNDQKIARWKKEATVDFFYHWLFKELTHLTVTSRTDLENYLRLVPQLLKGMRTVTDILSQ